MSLTSSQAERLGVEAHRQLSPGLEVGGLPVSANVSYQPAAEDGEVFTGIRISAAPQQRLGHRHPFVPPPLEQPVKELSVDGGKSRLPTPLGEPGVWRAYKGICVHDQTPGAWFQDKEGLIGWINQQPLATPVTCLGDGHDGIGNIIGQVAPAPQRREILDWYPLMENLPQGETTPDRLAPAETFLWHGQGEATLTLWACCPSPQAKHFGTYLERHRERLVNYEYYPTEQLCSIG